MNTHYDKFIIMLKNSRKEQSITHQELADKVGVDVSYISKMENAKLKDYPSEEVITKIANVLNIDSDNLLILAKKIPKKINEIIINDELKKFKTNGTGLHFYQYTLSRFITSMINVGRASN